MYQGEVNVAQDDLNCFLSVAEELQVKGLTQGGSSSQSSHSRQTEAKPESFKLEKKSRPVPVHSVVEDDDIQEVSQVKAEPGSLVEDPQTGAVALEHDTYQEETFDYEAYDDGTGGVDPSTGMPYADGNKGTQYNLISSIKLE